MPTVELRELNRYVTGGIQFERGVRVPVTQELAIELADNERFRINWKDDGGGVQPLDTGDMAGPLRARPAPRAEEDLLDTGRPEITDDDPIEQVKQAIDMLGDEDEAYDPDGKPALQALSELVGSEVTEEMRDRAMGIRPAKAKSKTLAIRKAPKAANKPADSDDGGTPID